MKGNHYFLEVNNTGMTDHSLIANGCASCRMEYPEWSPGVPNLRPTTEPMNVEQTAPLKHASRSANADCGSSLVGGCSCVVGAGSIFAGQPLYFVDSLQHTRRMEIEQILPAALSGNFSLNLDMVRGTFESLPWVHKVEVRRVWPSRPRGEVEEHRAAGRWGKNELVGSLGRSFCKHGRGGGRCFASVVGPKGTATRGVEKLSRVCHDIQNNQRTAGAGSAITTLGSRSN